MTLFRPCIDLHQGQVKQIVGSTLSLKENNLLKTNFISSQPPSYYAQLYKDAQVHGSHVIKLGPNNDEAAREALKVWPKGMQIGGGITLENAQEWLDAGASKVIVTSYLFPEARFNLERLKELSEKIGKDNLVVDLRYF